jgi:hypothetical protein
MTINYMNEPPWIDEPDWLCAWEFLNDEDPEGRDHAADTIGYLLGYSRAKSRSRRGRAWHFCLVHGTGDHGRLRPCDHSKTDEV